MTWFDPGHGKPSLEWWWAVEHARHAGFYLRALMPGDFAPGRLPRPRHVLGLDQRRPAAAPVVCGTCGRVPEAPDLEPVERPTGDRGFLNKYRSGGGWPAATDEDTCWLCCDPAQLVNREAKVDEILVRVCRRCEEHLRRGR